MCPFQILAQAFGCRILVFLIAKFTLKKATVPRYNKLKTITLDSTYIQPLENLSTLSSDFMI